MSQTDPSRQQGCGSRSPASSQEPGGSGGQGQERKQTAADFLQQLRAMAVPEQVERLASLFFSLSDISLFTGIPVDELRREVTCSDSELSRAYRRGTLESQIQLRWNEMQFAGAGSPSALETMMRHLSQQKQEESA